MIPPQILPLGRKILSKARKLNAEQKLIKAVKLLSDNPFHPSLNTELLQPKSLGFWSFRVDRKIRAIFIWRDDQRAIEILSLTAHYH